MKFSNRFVRVLVGLLLGLAVLAFYWAVQSAIAYIFMLILLGVAKYINPNIRGRLVEIYNSNVFLLFIIGAVLTVALLYLFFRLIKKRFPDYIVIRKIDSRFLLVAFALGVFMNALTKAIIEMTPVPDKWLQENAESTAMMGNEWIYIFATFVAAPVVEEIIFRGLFYNTLKKTSAIWFAAIVSSAIFGVFHGNYLQSIYTFSVGLLCVYVYEVTGSLLSPIVLHMGYNSGNLILYLIGLYNLRTDMLFALSIIIVAALIALLLYKSKVSKDWNNIFN